MLPRWFPLACFAVLAACVTALPASADAARATLTPVGVSAFGHSSFVLTLPHGAAVPADGALTENGEHVPDVDVTPVTSVPGSYGVALLLDAGSRRAGRSIQGQLAAARAFLEQRPQGLPVSLITYNSAATVAVPFTAEDAPLRDALKQPPPLGRGARVVDATDAALDLFEAEGLGGGAIIALAGDPDDGSSKPAAAVAKRALKSGVSIFAATLAGGRSAKPTFTDLASDGVGQNLGTMSGPGLVALLTALGKQTGEARVLSYRSLAKPGSRVNVEFQGGGRNVRTLVTLPRAVEPRPVSAKDAGPDAFDRFTDSAAGKGIVSMAVAYLLFMAFSPLVRRARDRAAFHDRVSAYTADEGASPVTSGPVSADAPRAVRGGDRMVRLGDALELARMDVEPTRLVLMTGVSAVIFGYLVGALSGIPFAGVVAVGLPPLVARIVVRAKIKKQRTLFADQLADSLQAAAAAMRGGHSFMAALSTIIDECDEPSATEFRRVVAAERIGIPIEDAFLDMVRRMDNSDIQQVALVAILQRETGGNAAEALDRVVENLRGRDDVRRLVTTLTAQGRASRWVLTALPIGLGFLLTMINGEYMAPLYETGVGIAMLGVAAVLVALGSFAIGKIVEIEV